MYFQILLLLISFPLTAVTYHPQPIVDQIKEADGIILGLYLSSKSVKLVDGSVATQMIFKMNREFGMQTEVFGMDEVIIHYPGGKIGGLNVKVDGVPTFVPGEKVALMVKSIEDRYWGMNLAFGTFKVINYGKETLLVNSVFPEDPKVSQMKLEDFEKNIKRIKGTSFKIVMSPDFSADKIVVVSPRIPASINGLQGRSIASDSFENLTATEQPVQTTEKNVSALWLVVLLSLMGGAFRMLRQERVK